jgi:hypothetical protein
MFCGAAAGAIGGAPLRGVEDNWVAGDRLVTYSYRPAKTCRTITVVTRAGRVVGRYDEWGNRCPQLEDLAKLIRAGKLKLVPGTRFVGGSLCAGFLRGSKYWLAPNVPLDWR